ncbi:MAG: CPBP family intramembrane glutamic endopeptidase [Hyphomicrobiaceae bacterium]
MNGHKNMQAMMEASPELVPQVPQPPQQYAMFRGPSAYAPKTPWSPLGGIGGSLGIFAGAVLAVGATMFAAPLLSMTPESVSFAIVATLVQQVAMIGLTWFAATRYGGPAVDVLALRAPAQGFKSYWVSLLLLAFVTVAMSILIHLSGFPVDKSDIKIFESMFKSDWWWLAVILVGIGAPLSEEFLCRGFLFSALANSRIGPLGAATVTSLGFALAHPYSILAVTQVFVIGMLFSWMLIRTGSLRVTMVCHSIFNTLQAVMLMNGVNTP